MGTHLRTQIRINRATLELKLLLARVLPAYPQYSIAAGWANAKSNQGDNDSAFLPTVVVVVVVVAHNGHMDRIVSVVAE